MRGFWVVLAGALNALSAGPAGAGEPAMEYSALDGARVSASSALPADKKAGSDYAPGNAADGDTGTSWCAGAGKSAGESIELEFDPVPFSGVAVLNGMGKSKALYQANNRVEGVDLVLLLKDGARLRLSRTLSPDACQDHHPSVPDRGKSCYLEHRVGGELILLDRPACVRGLRLEIRSAAKGRRYDDTCIAEIKRASVSREEAQWDEDPATAERIRQEDAACSGAPARR